MKRLNNNVISFDPIYAFTKEQLINRIQETKDTVMEQTKQNKNNFCWTIIKNLDDLEKIRMSAMTNFILDFKEGKNEKRYIPHELPNRTSFSEKCFDIGLSSHFLLLYFKLGLNFHIKAIDEMLRICKEIRIFPILDLDGKKSNLLEEIIKYYANNYDILIIETNYEFQKNGNELLIIKHKN